MTAGQQHRSVIVEADGGSRGNPGNAAYGAVLKDASTGEVIAERGERIGVATNNVAEYRGLIAGLELYQEHAAGAELECRLDSRLVVEQMSGTWRIKHPAMLPLAAQAKRLAPAGTTYTWVPREQNQHADRLANEALDRADAVPVGNAPVLPPRPPWEQGPPTTLVLVRHGDTDHTRARVFSGRSGSDPGLNEEGRAQVRATAAWLAPLAEQAPVVLSSPMRRTRESAEVIADRLGTTVAVEEGLVEAGFGAWEGLTFKEVLALEPEVFPTWFTDFDQRPGGSGDSLSAMAARMEQTRDRLLESFAGRTVVAVSHLTPIKLLVGMVLETPLSSLFRTEVLPASVTVLAWYPDGRPVLRLLNGMPSGEFLAGSSLPR